MNDLQIKRRGSRMKISGDLTIYSVSELKPQLRDLLDASGDVVIDLSEVGEFDSAGFQLLAWARREAETLGKALCVEKLSEKVQEVFSTYRVEWHSASAPN